MKIVTVANQKGGVGKSTITCNLSVVASARGDSVLIIDADPQGSSAGFRAIRKKDDIKAISMTGPNIHKDIFSFSSFDWVFIDSGGRQNPAMASSISASGDGGLLIIPVTPSTFDVWGTEDTLKLVQEIRGFREINAYFLLNGVQAGTKIAKETKEALDKMAEQYAIKTLNTITYARVANKVCLTEGQGVTEHEPNGQAAEEIRALFAEIQMIMGGPVQ